MKLMFNTIKYFFTPLGFLNLIKNHLPENEIFKIMENVETNFEEKLDSEYKKIYHRPIYYRLIANQYKQKLKSYSSEKIKLFILIYLQNKFIYYIIHFFGFIKYLFSNKFLDFSYEKNCIDSENKMTFITFKSKSKKTMNRFYNLKLNSIFFSFDRSLAKKMKKKLLIKDKLKYLKIANELLYISSESIINIINTEFFLEEIILLKKEKSIFLFSEGLDTISAVLSYRLTQRKIDNAVFFSRCLDKFYLSQMHSKFNFIPFNLYKINSSKLLLMNDFPFMDWRDISSKNQFNKNDFSVGLLNGDGFNRFEVQKEIDSEIIKYFNHQNKKLILRPHPQTLDNKIVVNFYEYLKNNFKNISLHTKDVEDFLKKINIMIAYTNSTLILEALLSQKIVLIYKNGKSMTLETKVYLEFFKGQFFIFSDLKELNSILKNLDYNKLYNSWNLSLQKINFDYQKPNKNWLEKLI